MTLTVTDDDGATDTLERDVKICGTTTSLSGKILVDRNGAPSPAPPPHDLFALDAASGTLAQLTDSQITSSRVEGSRYSPDGSKIAFYAAGGIWVMDADGSNRLQLTTDDGSDPVFTPDGLWVAYLKTDGIVPGSGSIYFVRTNGSGTPVRVPNTTSRDRISDVAPSIGCVGVAPVARTPGCYRVAINRITIGSNTSTIVSLDGSGNGLTTLVGPAAFYGSPRFSPDGTRLAYDQYLPPSRNVVYVLALDEPGATPEAISSGADDYAQFPIWSPDGKAVLFTQAYIDSTRDFHLRPRRLGHRLQWLRHAPALRQCIDLRLLPRLEAGHRRRPGSGRHQRADHQRQPLPADRDRRSARRDLGRRDRHHHDRRGGQLRLREPARRWQLHRARDLRAGLRGRSEWGSRTAPPPSRISAATQPTCRSVLWPGLFDALRLREPSVEPRRVRSRRGRAGTRRRTGRALRNDDGGRWTLRVHRAEIPAVHGDADEAGTGLRSPVVSSVGSIGFRAFDRVPTRIAFVSGRDGNDEIYAADADGQNPANLTQEPATDRDPSWSPDGMRIAFTSDRNGGVFALHVMDADGYGMQELFVEGRQPAWSPDGTRLVYATDSGLRTLDLASDFVTDTTYDASDASPAFRPDGSGIAFARTVAGNTEIWELDFDSGFAFERVLGAGFDGDPAFCAVNDSFAYATQYGDETAPIQILAQYASGGVFANGRHPSWSPNCAELAYDDGAGSILRTDPRSFETPLVISAQGDRDPAWQPLSACANGIDDDGDGSVDHPADPGCDSPTDGSERARPGGRFACDDGIDNDGDGLIDHPDDPGCPNALAGPENPACDDGIDNDGNGLTDFGDPKCASSWPYWESPPACGLGAELVLLVPVIAGWRRRARRSGR